eukprot:TRINITY_DN22040_c0_g1_i1.p1 TRINITY_DN22040_c0_g1~~TRINITY_DN22040_c0_g1_i1.p1  ORF type:complete len:720 (+),score=100.06 TRINITY_DN22040_c0_g1_i1:32-2191(+)
MTETENDVDDKIFEYFFVASRVENPDGKGFSVEVLDCFPKKGEELVKEHPKVDVFCFPEGSKEVVKRSRRFTFTLTDASGGWLYGFCIRAERRKSKIPDCLCILSKYPWFDMFYEVLCYDQLQYSSGMQPTVARTLYDLPFPSPGSRFSICTTNHRFYVTRPSDLYPLIDANIQDLYATFGVQTSLDLLLSILEEQRVLITGDDLDLVTGCIHALTALLYPFEWSYPFVPVLPPSMLDAICSPTPFIMGIHSEVLKQASQLPTENIILADTRNGAITGLVEKSRLAFPSPKIKERLKEIMEKKGRSKVDRTQDAIGVMSDFFAGIFGRLREFPVTVKSKKGEDINDFDDDLFLSSFSADRKTYPFVQAMIKTLMYQTLKQETDNWSAGKPDAFAEKCAQKYPDLWEPYTTGKDFQPAKKEAQGFLARFGRAKDKVKKEIDKKIRKGGASTPVSTQVASPVSQDSRTSSPDKHQSSGSPFPTTSWLNDAETPKVLIDSHYADFTALHVSLDPFVVHGGNVYEPQRTQATRHNDPFESIGAITAAPPMSPRSVIKDVVVCKVNGRVGCSYYRNEIAKVERGSGAYNAGIVPGCKMLAIDGVIMEGKESHEVKAMLDSAPQRFLLTVMMPGTKPGANNAPSESGKAVEQVPDAPRNRKPEEDGGMEGGGERSNEKGSDKAAMDLDAIFSAPATGDPVATPQEPQQQQPPAQPSASVDDEFPF